MEDLGQRFSFRTGHPNPDEGENGGCSSALGFELGTGSQPVFQPEISFPR